MVYNEYAPTVRATSDRTRGSECSMCVSTILGNASCNSWNMGELMVVLLFEDSKEEVGVVADAVATILLPRELLVALVVMGRDGVVTSGIRGPSAYTPGLVDGGDNSCVRFER